VSLESGRPGGLTPRDGDTVHFEGGLLHILDQTRLPRENVTLRLETCAQVEDAIRRLAVRGAPAIGIAGAYGVLLAALGAGRSVESIVEASRAAVSSIGATRPTARNLFWALEKMTRAIDAGSDDPDALLASLLRTADSVALEVIETDRALVEAGQELVFEGSSVLTHCNSGPLAALRFGTALGVLIEAYRCGKEIHVFVDETRPLLQGARLTTWELARAGVPHTLITDSMAGMVMGQGKVDLVMTGADRIAANGDSANKVGTYGLAVLARAHGIPFYIAAPGSTVDASIPTGREIIVEERDPDEVRAFAGRPVAPDGVHVYNPAFDVTPAGYIDGIVTDRGILRPPYGDSLKAFA